MLKKKTNISDGIFWELAIHNAPPERFIRSIGQWQELRILPPKCTRICVCGYMLYFWIFHGFFRFLLCVLIGSFALAAVFVARSRRCTIYCTDIYSYIYIYVVYLFELYVCAGWVRHPHITTTAGTHTPAHTQPRTLVVNFQQRRQQQRLWRRFKN